MKRYIQHGDGPTFTVPKVTRRVRRDYGSEYPRKGFFASNKAMVISLLVGAVAIFTFLGVLTIGLLLLPNACLVEVERQVAVVEQSLGIER